MSTLRKALKLAKKCGMTKAEFAQDVIGCGATKLWMVEQGTATLKHTEEKLMKDWYRTLSEELSK